MKIGETRDREPNEWQNSDNAMRVLDFGRENSGQSMDSKDAGQ